MTNYTNPTISFELDDCCDTNYLNETLIEQWLHAIQQHYPFSGDVYIRIVNVEESKELNSQYRQQAKPTNVLSFPFEYPESLPEELALEAEQHPTLGDLIICRAIVESEAHEQHKPMLAHWAHMVVHGCLHLFGFDHIEDNEAQHMERLEIDILNTLGYTNPYEPIANTQS